MTEIDTPGRHARGAPDLVYKILSTALWRQSEAAGVFHGSPIDLRDGFIHLSAPSQVVETAARHFTHGDDLLLVAVDASSVPIRWEPSRGGALFPHLYAPLPLTAVRWVKPLPRDAAGRHVFPPL